MNAFLHFSAYGVSYKFDVAIKQDFKDPQINQVRTSQYHDASILVLLIVSFNKSHDKL